MTALLRESEDTDQVFKYRTLVCEKCTSGKHNEVEDIDGNRALMGGT